MLIPPCNSWCACASAVTVRVCVGYWGKDSPRVWEACANLNAYGCLVVRGVCIINCWHTSDPPLPTLTHQCHRLVKSTYWIVSFLLLQLFVLLLIFFLCQHTNFSLCRRLLIVMSPTYRIVLTITYLRLSGAMQSNGSTKSAVGCIDGSWDVIGRGE